MNNLKIKSYCKINLSLKVLKKLKNNYHNIRSLISFCEIYDLISISRIKNSKDKITFSGSYKAGIKKKSNSIVRVLNILRKNRFLENQYFKINVIKNIPQGAGLGGGSSNAANLLNFLNIKMKLNLNKSRITKIANLIGFDVPICLEKKNTFLTGKKGEIIRLNQSFGLNLLIVYPNIVCSTKKIYEKNKKISSYKSPKLFHVRNKKHLVDFLKYEKNDLEKVVVKLYPKIGKIINFINSLKGCYFSRISGSGSSCIGIFSNKKNAIYAQKLIKLKYPKYWCVVSKTI